MRYKVLDTNYAQNDALRAYLSESRFNGVVLIDLVSMELHKHNAIGAARGATQILRFYPHQVFVLHLTRSFYPRQINARSEATSLISRRETRGFARYVADLHNLASVGHAERHAIVRGIEFRKLAAQLLRDSLHIPHTFKDITKGFSAESIKKIRLHQPLDKDLQLDLLGWARSIAINTFVQVVEQDSVDPDEEIRFFETPLFRYALCIVLLYMRWVANGQPVDRKPEKFANDVVDMHVAAMSSFFGGVLSADANVVGVAAELRHLATRAQSFVG